MLVDVLDGIAEGRLAAVPQAHEGVSLAPKLTAADAEVRWSDPDFAVDRRIRACTPAPGAWTTFRGDRLKLGPVAPTAPLATGGLAPGELRVERGRVLAGTGTAAIVLGEIRAAGKKPMPADAWARGLRIADGERLG